MSGINPRLEPILHSLRAPCQKDAQGAVALAGPQLCRMKGKCRCLIKLLLQEVRKLASGLPKASACCGRRRNSSAQMPPSCARKSPPAWSKSGAAKWAMAGPPSKISAENCVYVKIRIHILPQPGLLPTRLRCAKARFRFTVASKRSEDGRRRRIVRRLTGIPAAEFAGQPSTKLKMRGCCSFSWGRRSG